MAIGGLELNKLAKCETKSPRPSAVLCVKAICWRRGLSSRGAVVSRRRFSVSRFGGGSRGCGGFVSSLFSFALGVGSSRDFAFVYNWLSASRIYRSCKLIMFARARKSREKCEIGGAYRV